MKGSLLTKQRKNKKLAIILLIAGLITAYNFGKDYLHFLSFSTPTFVPPLDENQTQLRRINIDFSALDNLEGLEFNGYETSTIEMPTIESKNPYLPYYHDDPEQTEEME